MSQSKSFRFNAKAIENLVIPSSSARDVYRDDVTPGLELRVTSSGSKTFSVRQRVKNGGVERVTIGPFGTATGLTVDQARIKAKQILGVQADGQRYLQKAVADARAHKTLEEALRSYVDDASCRTKPLKQRTKSDYLEMIRPAGNHAEGKRHASGPLWNLSRRRLRSLTGAELKVLFGKLVLERGQTRASYAMRVLRAVLNYEGVSLDVNPFARATPKRDRVVLPASKARTRIIPDTGIASWWAAASATRTGDAFQLMLLTGMRHGEVKEIRRRDVDLASRSIVLPDPKNREPHTIYLSDQALALVKARVHDQAPDDLFWEGAGDPRDSLERIIRICGIAFSAHDCRRTFASMAGRRLPGYVVKKLMNHKQRIDVTSDYMHFDEAALRAAWQRVADAFLPKATCTALREAANDDAFLDGRLG